MNEGNMTGKALRSVGAPVNSPIIHSSPSTGELPIPAPVATPKVEPVEGESPGAPLVSTGKKKGRRKRTMSGAGGEDLALKGGKREDSTGSGLSEPLLMYPVYGALDGAKTTNKEKESPRAVRMQSVQVCQRVLNHLLCDGALTLNELAINIAEINKESIVAVLEVLDVMGIVMSFKNKRTEEEDQKVAGANLPAVGSAGASRFIERAPITVASGGTNFPAQTGPSGVNHPSGFPLSSPAAAPFMPAAAVTSSGNMGPGRVPPIVTTASTTTGNAISSPATTSSAQAPILGQSLYHRHSGEVIYAIRDFAKGTEFTQFTGMKEQLKVKRGNIKKIQSRIDALDGLTRSKHPQTRGERVQALRKLLTELVAKETALQNDQLYRAVMEQPSFSGSRRDR